MARSRFPLIVHPWLFLFVFFFATLMCFSIAEMFLLGTFGMPRFSQVTSIWQMLLGNSVLLFIVVPFILGFPKRKHPYETYLSEIHLTHITPLIKLILFGISCYMILALCHVAGVLIYRLAHHLPISMSFMHYSFGLPTSCHLTQWAGSIPFLLYWKRLLLGA